MRKIILTIFIVIININTVYGDEYLISNAEFKSGGFGGFGFSNMKVNKKNKTMIVGGGGWVIDDTFYLGGRSYATKTKQNKFSIGGLELGYIYSNPSPYNPFISIVYGAGIVTNDNRMSKNKLSATILEAGVQVKLIRWMRIVPFIGWTSISFDDSVIYKDSDFGGFSYGFRLDFGNWKK